MADEINSVRLARTETDERPEPPSVAEGREQGVIVGFTGYNHKTLDPLIDLQLRLTDVIEAVGVGEMDGNEIEDNEGQNESGMLFMYGPDADRLYEVVRTTLLNPDFQDFMQGAEVLLEYGLPDTNPRTRLVRLDG